MTPKKPEWFEMTEDGDSYSGIQKMNKKLPIITLVVAGAVVLGGSIFATANNEPAAVAETPAPSQSVATQSGTPTPIASSSHSASLPVPTVTNVPQRGDREHEGREGGHERGEGREHEGGDDD